MEITDRSNYSFLDLSTAVWDRIFMVAPLVVVGTREGLQYDMAPKHMAFPVGFENYFGFVCTPEHSTYQNIRRTGEFTVSFPLPEDIVPVSISATSREELISKYRDVVSSLPVARAESLDVPVLRDAYLIFECSLFKIIDGFGENSIITGEITAAYVKKEYRRVSDSDAQEQLNEYNLLAFIAPDRFARVSNTHRFPFPEDFRK
ncbi:flavin reductase [Salinimicrobium xinjiangense]|uniref:flavin reductase n=1 Tax=Salinimicrobium xinjiangense TaxID=438596 RepID=UPI00042536BE|nr:flavin reductase [Salinimicrobium xinjiangense]